MSENKGNGNKQQNSGTYNTSADLIAFYNAKVSELRGSGCGLKLERKKYIQLQFINPVTGNRTTKSCGVKKISYESVIEASQKAIKVANALKTFTKASEFWEWYDREILGKNKIKNDLITYREIFKQIEDKYFSGKHRDTGSKRRHDPNKTGNISDVAIFHNTYGYFFAKFPDWDKYPTWGEIKSVWLSLSERKNIFNNAKIAIIAICQHCPNADYLIKKIDEIDPTQTERREKKYMSEIIYPDSDGQPIADNTIQFRWITIIYQNLAWLFAENPEVFVAGDLLWYPVEGNNKLSQAPDVMVAFGVAKGDRGSYQQWKENNIAPQVVFEILSPGNTPKEMNRKLLFYDRYGVEEYYVYDPDTYALTGWLRSDPSLEMIEEIDGWVSPRLGIRFEIASDTLVLYRPDGEPFADYTEVQQKLETAKNRASDAENRAAEAENRANLAEEQLEQERQRAKKLEELLRQAGLDPNIADRS